MTTFLNDTFTDTDGTSLNSHMPDSSTIGSTWSSTAANSFYIQSNALQSNRNADNDKGIIGVDSSDYTLKSNVTPYNSGSNQSYPGLVFRYQDSSNYWYVYPDALNDIVDVRQVIGGADTRIIHHHVTITSGVSLELRIDVIGANITLYVDGTEIVTHVSGALQTAKSVGVRYGKSGAPAVSAIWDNFTVISYAGIQLNWPVYVKDTSNPVIPLGATGSWEDSDINDPNVVYDSVAGQYVNLYTGYKTGTGNVQNVGIATAPSIAGPWTKYVGNPVMTATGVEKFNNFNGGVCKKGSLWYQLYGVADASGNAASALAMATSPDLITWTRLGTVMEPAGSGWESNGIFDAFIRLRNDGVTFEAWYCGKNASNQRSIGYATSTDGVSWTRSTNAAFLFPQWANSSTTLGEPSVYVPTGKEGQEMLISFDSAYAETASNRFISQAITIDGGTTWHFRQMASVPGTGWESVQNFDSFNYYENNKLYLFYGGGNVSGPSLGLNIQIGSSVATWPYNSFLSFTTIRSFPRTLGVLVQVNANFTGTIVVRDGQVIKGTITNPPGGTAYRYYGFSSTDGGDVSASGVCDVRVSMLNHQPS